MKIVADRLVDIADSERGTTRFDLFTRSAFNRYYYSAYLAIRDALERINAGWKKDTKYHAKIPSLLSEAFPSYISKEASKAAERKLLTPADARRFVSQAEGAAKSLSGLISRANGVRKVADYQPDAKVVADDFGGTLAGCTIVEARDWQQRIDFGLETIRNACDQIGVTS